MSSAPHDHDPTQYDRTLLAQAPLATRAQRQQGYDHVLLEPNRRAKHLQPSPDLELKEFSTDQKATAAEAQSPRWQSWRWKLIAGAVITLVVIAAIVGGAVGATAHKRSRSSSSDTVGVNTLSASGQSGISIFGSGSPSATATTTSQGEGQTLSQGFVAVATQPVPSSDIFAQRTARHFPTGRRR
ncbi:hypothetical protein B0H14DRAFT_56188 [Mycena olivaceomarginata]|nr:hypothetical protein B0H14DRAFT_56188 [Mycena olivaceomarginata]